METFISGAHMNPLFFTFQLECIKKKKKKRKDFLKKQEEVLTAPNP